jgi:hypothetical protein
MNIPIVSKWLSGVAFAAVLWGSGVAQAAPCTVVDPNTNPDASLANSTSCGAGSGDNDTAALVNTQEPSLTNWSKVDRDDGDGADGDAPEAGFTEAALSLTVTSVGGNFSGNWFIDQQGGLNSFLIVLKDGVIFGTDSKWFWFVIDTAAGCAIDAPEGTEFCGTWSMYGTGGEIKNLSHMTLYGTTDEDIVVPPLQIPEPAAPLLLGIGLLGLWLTRRRSIG